jgi:putative flavoprotein involved in K+ transport
LTTCPGLGFVGLEWQRSFASATLRGVGRDAHYVVRRLLARRSEQPRPHTGHQWPGEIRGRGADGR